MIDVSIRCVIRCSFGVLLGHLLGFLSPVAVLVVGGRVGVHRSVQVRYQHQRFQLLHNGNQFLGRSPLAAGLNHVLADLAFLVDVRVVDLGTVADDGSLEGEVVKFELDGKLSSFEG